MSGWADIISLRALGAEYRDRNRSSLRNIVAFNAAGDIVTQADGFGTLSKTAFRTRFDQREPATALPQEIRGARPVRQQCRGAGHEHETRLLKAGGGGLRPDADDVAQRARDFEAWKQRRQR